MVCDPTHFHLRVRLSCDARLTCAGVLRKKEKFAAQKLSMEQEMKNLSDKLSEGRVVEEGIR